MFTTDSFLVSNFYNILYLTQFETLSPFEREAHLLVVKGKKIIITDARYKEEKHSEDSELYILQQNERVGEAIYRICKENNLQTLECEADDLKWSEVEMLQKQGLTLNPINHALSSKRSIKTEEELFVIKQACHISDSVLKDVTPYIHPGQTEGELAWLIERSIREGYNADLAFDPIVAIDTHSAIPHYNTKKGSGTVTENSLILLDFGVKVHNYCSDCTRMVTVGDVSPEALSTYSGLLSVQEKTIEFIESVSQMKEIDIFCRNELKKNNLPNYAHATGHGIGLEVHEFPKVSGISIDNKKAGQVFTIEPGVYYPGKWGMRIEDTIAISDQGEVEVLTRFPKELILL